MAIKLVKKKKKHRFERLMIVVSSLTLFVCVFGIVATQAMITTESKRLQDTSNEVQGLMSINNNLNRERDQKADLESVTSIAKANGLENRIESTAKLMREKE